MTPSLAQTQHLLWQLITAPSGVAAGLQALADDPRLTAGLDAVVAGDAVLPAERRLDIYANMYFFRLLDALKEDYPTLHATIGEAPFHNLVTDYLLACPPTDPSLRYAGQRLPAFLATHDHAGTHPWAADIARFEWALVDAFDAADCAALRGADLAAVAPDRWPALVLTPSPSLQLLDLAWAVPDLWHVVREGATPVAPAAQRTRLRVWRHELRVLHCEVSDGEWAALQSLARGEAFGALCEAAALYCADTAHAMGAVLQRWVADGVLAAPAA